MVPSPELLVASQLLPSAPALLLLGAHWPLMPVTHLSTVDRLGAQRPSPPAHQPQSTQQPPSAPESSEASRLAMLSAQGPKDSYPPGAVASVRTTPLLERVGLATLHQRLPVLLAWLVAKPPASLRLSQFLLLQKVAYLTWIGFDLDFRFLQVGTLLPALDPLGQGSTH